MKFKEYKALWLEAYQARIESLRRMIARGRHWEESKRRRFEGYLSESQRFASELSLGGFSLSVVGTVH